MPKVTVTPHGIKAARAAGNNASPPKRGKSTGWSSATARRNVDFLKSIDPTRLDGFAVALSLTFGRDVPVTPEHLRRIREAFFKRLVRMEYLRLHWLIEFQGDGTPHVHMMVFFPETLDQLSVAMQIEKHWLELSAFTGTSPKGQVIKSVYALTGWLQYNGKHGGRGAQHYQRKCPEGWETPGRMWGKSGEWPTSQDEFECGPRLFFIVRRWMKNWRLADARKGVLKALRYNDHKAHRSALKRVRFARSALQAGSRMRSELIGFTEWIPPDIPMRMFMFAQVHTSDYFRPWDEHKVAPFELRGAQI